MITIKESFNFGNFNYQSVNYQKLKGDDEFTILNKQKWNLLI